jgi:hypothetical protein
MAVFLLRVIVRNVYAVADALCRVRLPYRWLYNIAHDVRYLYAQKNNGTDLL